MSPADTVFRLISFLGLSPDHFVADTVKWAGAKALSVAGDAAVGGLGSLVKGLSSRLRSASRDKGLREALAKVPDQAERQRLLAEHVHAWLSRNPDEAAYMEAVLLRVVYLRALEAACLDLPGVGLIDGVGEFSDVVVPQRVRLAAGQTAQDGEPQRRRSADLLPVHADIASALDATGGRRVLLVGEAGAGKSMQLRKFVLDRVRAALVFETRAQFLEGTLPVFVSAKDLAARDGAPAAGADMASMLVQAINRSLGLKLPFPVPAHFLDPRHAVAPRSVLVVVDDLDEVGPDERNRLAGDLSRQEAAALAFMIGTRPLSGAERLRWDGYQEWEVLGLDEAQTAQLVRNLSGRPQALPAALAPGVRRNPLLATLAVVTDKLQASPSIATLYQEFVYHMLRKARAQARLGLEADRAVALLGAYAEGRQAARGHAAAGGLFSSDDAGLMRERRLDDLLLATGLVARRADRLEFLHESFREYFHAQRLADAHAPDAPRVWEAVSPFVHGWRTVVLVCLIWDRDGRDVAPALGELFAFGVAGFHALSEIAGGIDRFPAGLADRLVARWMWRDEYWEAGLLNGPVQALGRMAARHAQARAVLERIAGDAWTYFDDAAYAAQELAQAGAPARARELLVLLAEDSSDESIRELAAELLLEIGCRDESSRVAMDLAKAFRRSPPDLVLTLMRLAKLLHRLGATQQALRMLKGVRDEADSELDMTYLAETYVELGRKALARPLARRVFQAGKWLDDMRRNYRSSAMDLASLLSGCGADKEAAEVYRRLRLPQDADLAGLRQMARARNEPADVRCSAIRELVDRAELADAGDALEGLVLDKAVDISERLDALSMFQTIPNGRQHAIALLGRILEDEPWHGGKCGLALVRLGDLATGYAALQRVASEPALSARDRMRAIESLATSGRLDQALSACRRLFLHPHCLSGFEVEHLAEVFLFTPQRRDYLDLCRGLLSAPDPGVRLAVIDLLHKLDPSDPALAKGLGKILSDRLASPSARMSAASTLEEIEGGGLVSELYYGIAAHPDESVDAGMEAMQRLSWMGDDFGALDGGRDVVWDKKLGPDEFIEAAWRYLRLYPPEHKAWQSFAGVRRAIEAELADIASDASAPPERRLVAAGLDGRYLDEPDIRRLREPDWTAVRAIADDAGSPSDLRLAAIAVLLADDPGLRSRYESVVRAGDMPSAEAAGMLAAAGHQDEALARLRDAFSCEPDAAARISILTELAGLGDAAFAARQAGELLAGLLRSSVDDRGGWSGERVREALRLMQPHVQAPALAALCRNLVDADVLYDFEAAIPGKVLSRLEGPQAAIDALWRRYRRKQGRGAWHRLHLLETIHGLGDADGALAELEAVAGKRASGFELRREACLVLGRLSSARRAAELLLELCAGKVSGDQLLEATDAAMELHRFHLARRFFRRACEATAGPDDDFTLAARSLRLGMPRIAQAQLARIGDPAQASLETQAEIISLYLELGRIDEAYALADAHLRRARSEGGDLFSVLDVLDGFPGYAQDRTFDLLRRHLDPGDGFDVKLRAAELMGALSHGAQARTLLFQIVDGLDAETSADDLLWLAGCLDEADLPISAARVARLAHSRGAGAVS